jgi:hypothetical protein
MNQRAKEQIRTCHSAKKININDALGELELEQIAAASNGNGSAPERVICQCAESIINGRRVPVHQPSDCQYVRARSALICEACKVATERSGDPTGNATLGYEWTRIFVREMDRLAFNAGLLR